MIWSVSCPQGPEWHWRQNRGQVSQGGGEGWQVLGGRLETAGSKRSWTEDVRKMWWSKTKGKIAPPVSLWKMWTCEWGEDLLAERQRPLGVTLSKDYSFSLNPRRGPRMNDRSALSASEKGKSRLLLCNFSFFSLHRSRYNWASVSSSVIFWTMMWYLKLQTSSLYSLYQHRPDLRVCVCWLKQIRKGGDICAGVILSWESPWFLPKNACSPFTGFGCTPFAHPEAPLPWLSCGEKGPAFSKYVSCRCCQPWSEVKRAYPEVLRSLGKIAQDPL